MSNKNESDGAAGIMAVGFGMLSIFLLFVAALLSLLFTIVCIFAWREDVNLFDKKVTPQLARGFIAWGVVGAIVVGLFGLFMNAGDVLLDRNVPWMPLIGYVIGSMGWAAYYAENKNDIESRAYERESAKYGGTILQRMKAERMAQREAAPLPPVESKPAFQFADWDDEELRG